MPPSRDLDLRPADFESGVKESRVTWATCVPILIFLGVSVLELFPLYVTDRRQTKASHNGPALGGA